MKAKIYKAMEVIGVASISVSFFGMYIYRFFLYVMAFGILMYFIGSGLEHRNKRMQYEQKMAKFRKNRTFQVWKSCVVGESK